MIRNDSLRQLSVPIFRKTVAFFQPGALGLESASVSITSDLADIQADLALLHQANAKEEWPVWMVVILVLLLIGFVVVIPSLSLPMAAEQKVGGNDCPEGDPDCANLAVTMDSDGLSSPLCEYKNPLNSLPDMRALSSDERVTLGPEIPEYVTVGREISDAFSALSGGKGRADFEAHLEAIGDDIEGLHRIGHQLGAFSGLQDGLRFIARHITSESIRQDLQLTLSGFRPGALLQGIGKQDAENIAYMITQFNALTGNDYRVEYGAWESEGCLLVVDPEPARQISSDNRLKSNPRTMLSALKKALDKNARSAFRANSAMGTLLGIERENSRLYAAFRASSAFGTFHLYNNIFHDMDPGISKPESKALVEEIKKSGDFDFDRQFGPNIRYYTQQLDGRLGQKYPGLAARMHNGLTSMFQSWQVPDTLEGGSSLSRCLRPCLNKNVFRILTEFLIKVCCT